MTNSEKKDWLNNFVEKNMWGIIMMIVAGSIFYATIRSEVRAMETKLQSVEDAIVGIVENQKDIIRIQEHEEVIQQDIKEIKEELKEIKKLLR